MVKMTANSGENPSRFRVDSNRGLIGARDGNIVRIALLDNRFGAGRHCGAEADGMKMALQRELDCVRRHHARPGRSR